MGSLRLVVQQQRRFKLRLYLNKIYMYNCNLANLKVLRAVKVNWKN